MRVYHRNKRHAICRRYCCLLHIYSSATVISFLTTGVEESEKGTGKTTAGFVLKSPLERIPVLCCCASMEALWARKAPLQCFLEQACYLTGCFYYAPYFGWSLKVCDNMHVGRVQQADQGALGGIFLKKKELIIALKMLSSVCLLAVTALHSGGFCAQAQVSMANKTVQRLEGNSLPGPVILY